VDGSVSEIAAIVVFAVERQAGIGAEAWPSRMHKRHANKVALLAWRFVVNFAGC
jgi:hypothetical protein